jgi:hypothetical protein
VVNVSDKELDKLLAAIAIATVVVEDNNNDDLEVLVATLALSDDDNL